jgi:hypothetical protein
MLLPLYVQFSVQVTVKVWGEEEGEGLVVSGGMFVRAE